MGTTTVYNLAWRPSDTRSSQGVLEAVKRIERRVFPKQDAMDFDVELKKSNTEMMVVLDDEVSGVMESLVVAYMLFARVHGVTLLHKICVSESHRRQGLQDECYSC